MTASNLLEFVRYALCSALALAIDFALYLLALRMGQAVPVAAALGFSVGLMTSYVLSVRWVFLQRRILDRRQELLVFCTVGVAGLLLTQLLLWLLVQRAAMRPEWAKLPTAVLVFMFNFSVRKALLFASLPLRKIRYEN
ncbi:GtrA family protein [Kinneretia aquatilis]|uniref:GtrA family protein n=1 Tax=Kinneretia aquatilis TaxID=2070761 RepID=UPI0014950A46|nr:GtrA family protein [Paucibacter aquatile]WIV97795.1 GtrA family protein [Paucibacter aquatile]